MGRTVAVTRASVAPPLPASTSCAPAVEVLLSEVDDFARAGLENVLDANDEVHVVAAVSDATSAYDLASTPRPAVLVVSESSAVALGDAITRGCLGAALLVGSTAAAFLGAIVATGGVASLAAAFSVSNVGIGFLGSALVAGDECG